MFMKIFILQLVLKDKKMQHLEQYLLYIVSKYVINILEGKKKTNTQKKM